MAHSAGNDSSNPRRPPAHHRLPGMCAALLLSSPAATAFAPAASVATSGMTPSAAPRSAVVRRYRVEGDSASVSDAHSFLPSRLSPIGRLDEPTQYESRVLAEEDSLVVVRFYSQACPSCRATRPLFAKWARELGAKCGASDGNADFLPVKVLEMPLNRANSKFMSEELRVDELPFCQVYYPGFGVVEGRVVLNKADFREFADLVEGWSEAGCKVDLENLPEVEWGEKMVPEMHDDGDCTEFC